MKKYRTHTEYLQEGLKNPKEAALYLNAAADENDPSLLVAALAQVAKAHGISRLAGLIPLSRVGLYKSVSKNGNPELKTLLGILNASGLQLHFMPHKRAA